MKLNTKPLSEVKLGMPVLADGPYLATLFKHEVKPNAKGTGDNLMLMFKLVPQTKFDREGHDVSNESIVMSLYASLVETENYDPNRRLCELADAFELDKSEDLTTEVLDKAAAEGQVVCLEVGYQAPEGQYGERNNIKRVQAPTTDQLVTAGLA